MVRRIKNWSKFQHFKDRRPPWIKLYRDLLDDIDWFELDGESAKALVMLWLIASENDGAIPEVKKLAFRLRMKEKEVEQILIKLSPWMEQDDITPISDRYQDDAPETETETETEKRQTRTPSRDDFDLAALPDSLSKDVWADFVKHRKAKKAPLTQTAVNRIASELATAMQAGWTADAALAEAMAAGWTGVKAEWLQNRVGTQRSPPTGNPQADNKPLVKPFPQRAKA